MDIANINILVERYRPLTGLSSLPFLVCAGNTLQTVWFHYCLEQTGTRLDATVTRIFILEGDQSVRQDNVMIKVASDAAAYDEPQLNEREYLAALRELPEDYSEQKMKRLLLRAEMEPLLPAYESVFQYFMDNRN